MQMHTRRAASRALALRAATPRGCHVPDFVAIIAGFEARSAFCLTCLVRIQGNPSRNERDFK
jgi:hypothetical protein